MNFVKILEHHLATVSGNSTVVLQNLIVTVQKSLQNVKLWIHILLASGIEFNDKNLSYTKPSKILITRSIRYKQPLSTL